MKRVLALALTASLAAGAAQAQEAFKHLGMSVEAGTTGLGINLSYPLVTDHLVLTLGYNLPSFAIKSHAQLTTGYVNGKIDQANRQIDNYNKNVNAYNQGVANYNSYVDRLNGLGIQAEKLNTLDPIDEKLPHIEQMRAELKAKLNFGNFKAMLEYYPTTQSYFHFTVGVMIGSNEWMDISATVDDQAWGTYLAALAADDKATNAVNNYNANLGSQNKKIDDCNVLIDQYNNIPGAGQLPHLPHLPEATMVEVDDAAAVDINGQTFVLGKDSNGRLDIGLKIKKVKPYLGVGFGSSVPTKHRVGCQFEIGAYYQGKPTLESAQEMPEFTGEKYRDKKIDDLVKTIVHFEWYPQLTLRFTGRLF